MGFDADSHKIALGSVQAVGHPVFQPESSVGSNKKGSADSKKAYRQNKWKCNQGNSNENANQSICSAQFFKSAGHDGYRELE